jgi:hypothetical protein
VEGEHRDQRHHDEGDLAAGAADRVGGEQQPETAMGAEQVAGRPFALLLPHVHRHDASAILAGSGSTALIMAFASRSDRSTTRPWVGGSAPAA